jgi:hypothetical protein
LARSVLSRNLLAQGNTAEAKVHAEKAITLSQQSPSQPGRFEAILADALVKAKTGKTSGAKKELEEMLAFARKFGYRVYEYEARLALAEIELQLHFAAALQELAALEKKKDAKDRGLLLIANHAQAAPRQTFEGVLRIEGKMLHPRGTMELGIWKGAFA